MPGNHDLVPLADKFFRIELVDVDRGQDRLEKTACLLEAIIVAGIGNNLRPVKFDPDIGMQPPDNRIDIMRAKGGEDILGHINRSDHPASPFPYLRSGIRN